MAAVAYIEDYDRRRQWWSLYATCCRRFEGVAVIAPTGADEERPDPPAIECGNCGAPPDMVTVEIIPSRREGGWPS